MFRVMLDPYGPVVCDDDGVVGKVSTAGFYSHIPDGWLDEVMGWLNGAGNNL